MVYLGPIAPIDPNNVTVRIDDEELDCMASIKKEVALHQSRGLRVVEILLNPTCTKWRLSPHGKYRFIWESRVHRWSFNREQKIEIYPVRAVVTVATFEIVVEEQLTP